MLTDQLIDERDKLFVIVNLPKLYPVAKAKA